MKEVADDLPNRLRPFCVRYNLFFVAYIRWRCYNYYDHFTFDKAGSSIWYVRRNTFYYYFPDIPALVDKLLEEKVDHLVETYYQPDQPIECIHPLIRYGLEHKRAVLHIYRYVDRAVFLTHLNQLALRLMQKYFQAATEEALVPDEAVSDLIIFFKCTMVGLLLDWLDGGMKSDMLDLTLRLCAFLEGTGKSALARLE